MTKCSKYFIVVLIALSGFWSACTQERSPCLTPKTASLILRTMHRSTDTSTVFVDTALPAAVFISLAKVDSNIGTIYSKRSSFTLSLSPDSNICRWTFTTDTLNSDFDTITFYYQRNRQFLSNACGFTYFYTIDSVLSTRHIIDSLHITNNTVTNNVNTKHLEVYIHPGF